MSRPTLDPALRTPAGRAAAAMVAVLAVLTVAGLAVLWPGEVRRELTPPAGAAESAEVTQILVQDCEGRPGFRCTSLRVRLTEGPDEGREVGVPLGEERLVPEFAPGDGVLVLANVPVPGAPGGDYTFVDYERRSPLLLLAAIFAGLVLVLGRWRGLRSLVGLAASLALVVLFVVPAILDERSPLLVALVGASAVMLVTVTLTHGISVKSVAALLGTAAALLLTVGLGVTFVELAHITGFSSEEAVLLRGEQGGLSLEGLVLAGIVIGALGVLDDVTVSQASAVIQLRRAAPGQGFRELFGRAIEIGRDHVGATVNTLVLAYVGASLPILLVFSDQGRPVGEAVNGEAVAEEILATLVGSIGLVAAVPATTALAAALATRLPPESLPADDHGHHH